MAGLLHWHRPFWNGWIVENVYGLCNPLETDGAGSWVGLSLVMNVCVRMRLDACVDCVNTHGGGALFIDAHTHAGLKRLRQPAGTCTCLYGLNVRVEITNVVQ